mmetsp:Transcript_30490/g.63657  ORF Transcript_30490/g.63657 Transcript_30490/m.63657 type:complete len:133 (-) Transcript_30490:145-543(-)|eukprot:CAMPEP_0172471120 /NCGR_PEP_ID=MMETSP1065-20121228/67653_1 /TAXON_ID=265537 /ORGANISM="Amphiprora paludosa, Strain CCMP125" /LENGTH=132 /DNA_ID=CAMNT_0013229207 /DNA_START=72 /DNA_END=470 /DNA_ORIENTATION=+
MKTAAVFVSLLAGASAFGITRPHAGSPVVLRAAIAEEEMTENQKEILSIQQKWSEIRHYSPEEAANLEPEWKEAYDRFNEKYDEDMERMTEISEKLVKMIEPPKVQKKTEGQRRRDKWAKVQALAAIRAAKK